MFTIGMTVMIKPEHRQGDQQHVTGTIVGLSPWRYAPGLPTGDRLIEFPDGTRRYYAPYAFELARPFAYALAA